MQINAGPPVTGTDYFSGRLNSVTDLKKRLCTSDVLLVGPRRTGKTSAAKEYINQERSLNKDFCASFIDLEEVENLYEFYMRVLKAIYEDAAKLSAVTDKTIHIIKSASTIISRLLPKGVDVDLSALGMPSIAIKAIEFDSPTITELRNKLAELLESLSKPLVIVLDEFPEVIWKFGKEEATEDLRIKKRAQETKFLLEGLRTLRQQDKAEKKHKIVVAGSINLKNTLVHLELTQLINDLDEMAIPYLSTAQALDLFNQLAQGEGFSFVDDVDLKRFIEDKFGVCSPFYIQLFAERMRQILFSNSNIKVFGSDELNKAYYDVLINPRGPAYLELRLKRYYSGTERNATLGIFEFICIKQLDEKKLPTEMECFEFLKSEKKLELNRLQQSELMAKLYSDNLLDRNGSGGWYFESPIICKFWHYKLVRAEIQ